MKLCRALKTAVDSVDLSTAERRSGATALAIVLLENVLSAEIDERDRTPPPLCGDESRDIKDRALFDSFICDTDDAYALSLAASTLYHAYALTHYRRLGVRAHIRKDEEMFDSMDCPMPGSLYFDD